MIKLRCSTRLWKMLLRGISTNIFRYTSLLNYHLSKTSEFAFSTVEFPLDSTTNNNRTSDDESRVLSQLSDVLPISIRRPTAANPPDTELEVRSADYFLQPEDKLRGVFLQKFCSKTSAHRALSGVGVELNADIFAKVLNKGSLCGESMVVFFNWAIERQNFPKDVGSYHILLKALGRRKFFEHMMEMVKNMRDEEISPNSETLFIVMDGYLRAGQVSKAIKVFGQLENHGLECNNETLGAALKCLSQRSHVGAACQLFMKMKEKVQCDCAMYNAMIGGWSKLSKVAEVEKLLKAMVDDGVEADHVTYSYVIEGFGRVGKVDDAVKIFEFLEENGGRLSVEVYNAMIFNYVANDDTDGALKYYERMKSNSVEPNMDTYARIISYFLKIRRVADAVELFDDMLGRGIVPSTGILTEFIEPLCRYGPPHAALMIYKKARKSGCRISPKAYKHLLLRLSRFGKCGMLLDIWDEMQETGYSSDMKVYECIINGLCNTGKLETAVLVMEECIRKGFFPGKIICSKLNNKLMDSNKVEIAYKLFLKLRNTRRCENAQRYSRAKGWHF